MEVLSSAYAGFWNEAHWLPPGFNWFSLQNTLLEQYPQVRDLRLPILYAFAFLAMRTLFERFLAKPLGRFLGIHDCGTTERTSLVLLILSLIHCPKTKAVECNGETKLADKQRVSRVSASTLDKFSESCWRFTFFLFIFAYGLHTLWNKPYFGSTLNCWYGYPLQPLTDDIYWYYMLELGFYWSLIISQFMDVHRKDFWVNFIHHIATILLLSFSWIVNFVRIGALVLLTHDAADCWLEATKMTRYCNRIPLSNGLFAIFALVWSVTRCVLLPCWIIRSTLIETVSLIGWYEAYYVFNVLLLILQVLHVLWTMMIWKILRNMLVVGRMDDVRSDSEDNEISSAEKKKGIEQE